MKRSNDFKLWIDYADEDLGSAKLLFLHHQGMHHVVGFLCQQASEKYLKALLIDYEIRFPKSHDLRLLLDLLSEKVAIPTSWYEKLSDIISIAVELRYPDIKVFPTDEQLKNCILIAEEIREWVQNLES